MAKPRGILGRVLEGLGVTVLVAAAVVLAIRLTELAFRLSPASQLVQVFEVAGVLIVGYTLSHRLAAAVKAWARQNDRLAQSTAIGLLLDLLVAVGVVLALFAVFNVGLSTILYGSALTGVVLALASQTLLANVFAGLALIVASPFRNGDRISIISSSYGALAPSYAHEMVYPSYTGRVEGAGLFYTSLRLDGGQLAKVPNSVVIGALVVILSVREARLQRVRVTLPHTMTLEVLRDAVAHPAEPFPPTPEGRAGPNVEIAEIGAASWDGLVTLWTSEPDEDKVRGLVLRAILPKLAQPPVRSPPSPTPL
ncbi:MAG: mechanosensitive ion channel family protein [Thermoplasmata archaeon]|nr:mechanosensitive ion channel family protein [Thermoplasmata archaeon]